ncbi:MAG: EAL domain-containing protein [Neglectibacter timonensis]
MMAKKKILVVEDNMLNREMLKNILFPEYEILEAENGQEALSILQAQEGDISLILLDIVMPIMNGYAFLSRIKADDACSLIPVVVTTQSSSEEDEVEALAHGATDFVSKPYRPEIIRHRIAGLIHLRETAAIVNQLRYDQLTGAYSKEYFYQQVKDTFVEAPEKEYDIVCSNVENFKLVNDVFGTQAGDCLLKGIVKICKEFAGGKGICGRIGADQFACMIEHGFNYTNDLFANIICRINDLSCAKNVGLKWGIYAVEDTAVPIEQMCDRALLAAHSIKGRYDQHFAVYDDAMREELLWEQTITNEMTTALSSEQFEVYLQPKYRLQDGVLAGAEALVRWNHPRQGFLSPTTFIPLFEKNGFITKLDQFVWDKTCAVLRQWDNKGYPPLSVSVNVSRADIYNADLTNILLKTVQKYGLGVSRLPLEITESAYTENPSQIIEAVESLKKLGFLIEMDDFGSGYSSLNMLNQLSLDILKLDMQFIRSETTKPKSQGILRHIMAIAGTMGLRVVAEGVETKEQLERLCEIGCDYGQGYYFAKPMPCEAFETLMRGPIDLI